MAHDVQIGGRVAIPFVLSPDAQDNYSVELDEYLDVGDTATNPVTVDGTGVTTTGANIVDNVLSFNVISDALGVGVTSLATEVTVKWDTTVSGATGVGISIPFEIVEPRDASC